MGNLTSVAIQSPSVFHLVSTDSTIECARVVVVAGRESRYSLLGLKETEEVVISIIMVVYYWLD